MCTVANKLKFIGLSHYSKLQPTNIKEPKQEKALFFSPLTKFAAIALCLYRILESANISKTKKD